MEPQIASEGQLTSQIPLRSKARTASHLSYHVQNIFSTSLLQGLVAGFLDGGTPTKCHLNRGEVAIFSPISSLALLPEA